MWAGIRGVTRELGGECGTYLEYSYWGLVWTVMSVGHPGLLHVRGGVPLLVLIRRGLACVFWRRGAARGRGTHSIR